MARCDEGYPCEVCGEYVHNISDSDLYLRFIIGEIDGRRLMNAPERHVRCNPTMAQFIVDDGFQPVEVEGVFDKHQMAAHDVTSQENLVTRGWRRLQQVRKLGIPISDYPLDEVKAAQVRKQDS